MDLKKKNILDNLQRFYHEKRYYDFLNVMKIYISDYGMPTDDVVLAFEYGKALAVCGYKSKAVSVLESIVNIGDFNVEIELALCYSTLEQKMPYDLDKAKKYLLDVISKYSGNDKALVSAYSVLASVYVKELDYDGAISVLKKGLSYFPNDAVLLNQLGMVNYLKNDYMSSITYYKKVLNKDPNNSITILNLGYSYMGLCDYLNGIRYFKTYITNNPLDFKGYLGLGNLYLKQGDFNGAIVSLDDALSYAKGKRGKASCLVELGNLYYRLRDYHTSEELYNRAIYLFKDSNKAYLGLYKVYQKTGREIDAKRILSYALSSEDKYASSFLINEHNKSLNQTFTNKI